MGLVSKPDQFPRPIDGLLRRTCPEPHIAKHVKEIWNRLASEFFKIPFVKSHPKTDRIRWAQDLTSRLSLNFLSRLVLKFGALFRSDDHPNYANALREPTFLDRSARFVVYGHTHRHLVVPLEVTRTPQGTLNQIYINSGTWRPYHQLTKSHPEREQFVPYQLMTYLAFFAEDERRTCRFEAWSGSLGG